MIEEAAFAHLGLVSGRFQSEIGWAEPRNNLLGGLKDRFAGISSASGRSRGDDRGAAHYRRYEKPAEQYIKKEGFLAAARDFVGILF